MQTFKIFHSDSILHASGIKELNSMNASTVRDEVRAALRPETEAVEMDLSETKFLDSSGLGALVSIRKTMIARNGAVRIINPTANVLQILELTKMHRVLEIVNR